MYAGLAHSQAHAARADDRAGRAARRFVIRLSFSNRYTAVKRVGTVLQARSA